MLVLDGFDKKEESLQRTVAALVKQKPLRSSRPDLSVILLIENKIETEMIEGFLIGSEVSLVKEETLKEPVKVTEYQEKAEFESFAEPFSTERVVKYSLNNHYVSINTR